MNRDFIEELTALFSDIKSNYDNSEVITPLLSKLKILINDFFASLKNNIDSFLITDTNIYNLKKIYDVIEEGGFEYNKVSIISCVDVLSRYKEYLEGLEEYIKTTFNVNEGEIDTHQIKEKNVFIFNKNEEYLENLFDENSEMSIREAMEQFEIVTDYIEDLSSFQNEAINLIVVLEQLKNNSKPELFMMKLSASSIYIYSLFTFNTKMFHELKDIVDEIVESIKDEKNPYIDEPKDDPVMF